MMRIRKSKNNRILLLNCTNNKGRIAMGKIACCAWHIAVKTEGFQHPGCIMFSLTNGRGYSEYAHTDTSKYSKCYVVHGGPGEFDVLLCWDKYHSPYPEILTMEVWCFGIYMGVLPYQKNSYSTVAHVKIDTDGHIWVSGADAGIWPEFATEIME